MCRNGLNLLLISLAPVSAISGCVVPMRDQVTLLEASERLARNKSAPEPLAQEQIENSIFNPGEEIDCAAIGHFVFLRKGKEFRIVDQSKAFDRLSPMASNQRIEDYFASYLRQFPASLWQNHGRSAISAEEREWMTRPVHLEWRKIQLITERQFRQLSSEVLGDESADVMKTAARARLLAWLAIEMRDVHPLRVSLEFPSPLRRYQFELEVRLRPPGKPVFSLYLPVNFEERPFVGSPRKMPLY